MMNSKCPLVVGWSNEFQNKAAIYKYYLTDLFSLVRRDIVVAVAVDIYCFLDFPPLLTSFALFSSSFSLALSFKWFDAVINQYSKVDVYLFLFLLSFVFTSINICTDYLLRTSALFSLLNTSIFWLKTRKKTYFAFYILLYWNTMFSCAILLFASCQCFEQFEQISKWW